MTPETVARSIRYKPGWRLIVVQLPEGGYLLWWRFIAVDVKSPAGEKTEMSSRRWWVEPDATPEAVVRLAFEAALRAEEHEAREWFRYGTAFVFDPHRATI